MKNTFKKALLLLLISASGAQAMHRLPRLFRIKRTGIRRIVTGLVSLPYAFLAWNKLTQPLPPLSKEEKKQRDMELNTYIKDDGTRVRYTNDPDNMFALEDGTEAPYRANVSPYRLTIYNV